MERHRSFYILPVFSDSFSPDFITPESIEGQGEDSDSDGDFPNCHQRNKMRSQSELVHNTSMPSPELNRNLSTSRLYTKDRDQIVTNTKLFHHRPSKKHNDASNCIAKDSSFDHVNSNTSATSIILDSDSDEPSDGDVDDLHDEINIDDEEDEDVFDKTKQDSAAINDLDHKLNGIQINQPSSSSSSSSLSPSSVNISKSDSSSSVLMVLDLSGSDDAVTTYVNL